MATLSGNKIKDTYQSLIKLTDNGNLTTGAKQLTDGFGNNSPLYISTTQIGIGVTPEATYDLHVYSNAKVGGNLTVTGDLTVEGTTTTIDTQTLTVEDPLIEVASNNTSTDAVDIGWYGKYAPSGTVLYAGLFRDTGDSKFKLFRNLEEQPTTTVNTSGTGYTKADLVIGDLDALDIDAENITLPTTGTNSGIPSSVGVAYFGNTNNRIFNDSSGITLRIQASDNLDIKAENFSFSNTNGSLLRGGDSGVRLYYQNSEKLTTTTNGIEVTGTGSFTGQVTIPATPVADTDAASKGYVDGLVEGQDTLAEILANGNTTGGTDLIVSTSDQIFLPNGSLSNPALSFTNDTDTGISYDASSGIRFSLGASERFRISNNFINFKPDGFTRFSVNYNGIFAYLDTEIQGELTVTGTGQSSFAGQVTIPATPVASTDAASKGYVDSQVGANNELSEVLANGNTTGGTDIAITAGDKITNFTSTGIDDNATSTSLTIASDGVATFINNIDINGNNKHIRFIDTYGNWLIEAGDGANNFKIHSQSLAADYLTLEGGGQLNLGEYGSGSFTGTAAYNLSVDSSGNIIETAGGVVDGSGTATFLPRWLDSNTLGDSILNQSSNDIIIGYNSNSTHSFEKTFATGHATGNRGAEVHFGMDDGGGNVGMRVIDSASSNASFNAQHIEFHTHEGGVSVGKRMEILSTGNSIFYNNVGIGTTSPSTKLHLGGTAPLDSIIRQDSTVSGTNWEIGERAAGKWQIWEDDGDSVVATFMSSGNVGIGTDSPDAIFHVAKANSGGIGGQIVIDNPTSSTLGNSVEISFLTDAGASGTNIRNARILAVNENAGNGAANMQFHTWNGSTSAERMRITSDGILKFTNIAQTRKLSLYEVANNNFQFYGLGIESNTLVYSVADIGDSHVFFAGTGTTTRNELMRIDGDGNVGIGETSPTSKLHVKDTPAATSGAILTLRNSQATASNTTFGGIFFSSTPGYDFSIGKSNVNSTTTLSFRNGNSGASLMDIDAAGNVGIGTDSPSSYNSNAYNLVIAGSGNTGLTIAAGTSDACNIFFSDGTSGDAAYRGIFRYSHTDDAFTFYTAGANERMRIDSTGNTTINGDTSINRGNQTSGELLLGGTTDGGFVDFDGTSLQLNTQRDPNTGTFVNTGKSNASINLVGAAGGSYIRFNTAAANNTTATERMRINSVGDMIIKDYGNIYASINNSTVNSGIYFGGTDNTLRSYTNDTERMRIDSSGNVGIGTDSPDEKLDVVGKMKISDDIILAQTNGRIDYDNGNSNGALRFHSTSANEEKMRITSGGDVLIGTTSSISSYGLLHVKGNQKGITVQDTTGPYRSMYLNSSGNFYFYNGTNEGYLSSAGAWTDASDERIKKNIVNIKYGLEEVLKSKPRSYQMKQDDLEQIGFIAQEMKEIIPECVSGDEERQLGISYGSLVSVAFKAIQEQQAIIEDLKSRIETLENN